MAKYDFMSFGEPNIRMTPPNHDRLGQSDTLQLGIAAAELNCCVNISNLSVERLMPQKKTAYVTKLVDNWTGKYIVEHARMYGVDMSNVVVEPFDKIGRTRNGLAAATPRSARSSRAISTGNPCLTPAGSTPPAL